MASSAALLPPVVDKRLRDFAGGTPLRIRHPGAGEAGSDVYCHAVVRDTVAASGGRQCFGWLHSLPAHAGPQQGAHGFTFHSVWLAPDGQLVDVAPHTFSRDGWSVFIPDRRRRYDFAQDMGYNALVIYTDARVSAYARKLSGLPVATYEGRFRRASRYLAEIERRYGLRSDGRRLVGLEGLNRSQRIELAFNYGVY
ncbi:MAG: hypothetical protein EKK49_14555 [Rhodocyclaceae bacterium]|nr:MAG: hypothetical protein EKK49_14555 [Rhodocyclaceae bacterium]